MAEQRRLSRSLAAWSIKPAAFASIHDSLFSRSERPKSRLDCGPDPSPRQNTAEILIEYQAETLMHAETRYSSKARAFRLPYFDGCRYDSNRNRCSIHSTQRREQSHWFRAVEADRPKLNERIEPVEFCGTSEDGNVTEQPRQERASPSRARRVERIGEFFAIAVTNYYRFQYDSGRLNHQYRRLKGQPHQYGIIEPSRAEQMALRCKPLLPLCRAFGKVGRYVDVGVRL